MLRLKIFVFYYCLFCILNVNVGMRKGYSNIKELIFSEFVSNMVNEWKVYFWYL